jgi:Sulfotransferase family
MNPFLFIVGCPRSGTTLLRRIVGAHPDIAITKETHWIIQLLEGEHAASTEAPVTPELLARLLSHRRFARLELDPPRIERLEQLVAEDRPVSYAELITTVFDLCGEMSGKRLVGDKTPRYVRDIPTLHGLWPRAKFVHLIRDGRDVCLSVWNWDKENRFVTRISTFEEDPVSTIALWWEQLVRLGREAGAELPADLYHEVRYERLVAEPAEECRQLCEFLGVPYDERMLRFHEGRTKHDPGLDAKSAWRPITPGLRNWRTEMAGADIERFEAVAGDLLGELGYPRGAPEPAPAARMRAEAVRDSYVREAGRHRLPARWTA